MPAWIKRKIMSDIEKAINATDRSTHIFYITSAGGEGKTVLLRQIGQILGSENGIVSSFPWSGILDLYHSKVNTNSGLETHLIEALETQETEFQRYRDERDAFAARREAGVRGEELEVERARMAEVFAECMNDVTQWSRVVIALDTTERIQYEVDDIQKLCQIEDESTTVKTWLLDQLQRWQKCVILLVGRPEEKPYLGEALANTLTGKPNIHYSPRELGGFDEDEIQDYFSLKKEDFPALNDLDSAFLHRLGEITEGRPIRLDLAIEVIQHGLGFNQFREKIEQRSAKEARKEIDRLLIRHVMENEPDSSIRDILRYLAVARKGLDAALLHHLAGTWDIEKCQRRLDAISERSFVKQHPDIGRRRLFLHDEMYQLCDEYLLRADEVQQLSRRIVEWYDLQLEAGKEKEKQDIEVDSALYRLRADPREGYHCFARQDEYAIRAAETGFDMRLRNEAIAFLKSRSPIDERLLKNTPDLEAEFNCDSAARWVKRLMVRGANELAVNVAEKVIAAQPNPCRPDDPKFALARADLAVYHAQALIYTNRATVAVDILQRVIADHEGGRKPEQLALENTESYAGWRRNLILGRAHNNLGYAYWMDFRRLEAALKAFRSALPYFRASDLLEETANTDDNMGRVHALRRRPTRAAALVEDGIALRRQLGLDYRIALSLNSRAIVHLEFEEPYPARLLAQEALGIFDFLKAQRGIGLALITLGRARRHLGGFWAAGLYSPEKCNEHFTRSAEYLKKAMIIFEHMVKEPVRQIEALNELGCAYRDRGRLALATDPKSPLARAIAAQAIELLKECAGLATEHDFPTLYVDTCEDLAQTYCLRKNYNEALTWLKRATDHIHSDYKFEKGKPLSKEPEGEATVEVFWLLLGKIELLHGNIAFDIGTNEDGKSATRDVLGEAVQHYILSTAYFEQFSPQAAGLKTTLRQIYDRLKYASLDDLRYLQEKTFPAVAEMYMIDSSLLGRFFEDTLGLALDSPG